MRKWLSVLVLGCLLAACAPAAVISESTATPGPTVATATGTPNVGVSTSVPGTLDANATPEGRGDKDVVVVFERGGGIDGRQEKWTIYADGTITLADGPEVTALEVGSVSAQQVADLQAGVAGLGFFEMADQYGVKDNCADCFQYTVSVTNGGVTKTVITHDAASDAPAELGQVLSLIQAILQTTT